MRTLTNFTKKDQRKVSARSVNVNVNTVHDAVIETEFKIIKANNNEIVEC